MFGLHDANTFVFAYFTVHYILGPLKGMEGSAYFQFQGQASLYSDKSTPEQDALILAADQCTLRSILTTTVLENHNREVCQKPDFTFGDSVLDTDQQIHTGEGQWIFSVGEEKYYLPSSK